MEATDEFVDEVDDDVSWLAIPLSGPADIALLESWTPDCMACCRCSFEYQGFRNMFDKCPEPGRC